MRMSIILPRIDSDKTDKGLIPKTFGVSAENFTKSAGSCGQVPTAYSKPQSPTLSHEMHILGAELLP